ncbi:MAG: UDP-N-acetylmuramoyl-L-alanyl-D-glutamate--2,6-diaminopimelate ligase [Oscillospiraceae bacterium]|nr:UDP-N-acetylmuramoyl-L-alanyl-D-glutamate--2,6-diaminopimelate ligase [Oscillospiraceae bacterium]
MLLSKLFERINVKNSYADKDFLSLSDDSRKIGPGDVFVCIRGARFDAHDYAAAVLEKGAAAVVVERDLGLPDQILVENTREAYSHMCAAFFGHPAEKLKLVGITGTNGKTTTAFLMKGMLDAFGKKTGLLGTVKYVIGEEEIEAGNTTPEAFEIQELFAKMAAAGCEYCVMEVSSQALAQYRVAGLRFAAAVFTNLTQDHLDYHGSFENYVQAKAMLFQQAGLAVMNADDAYWQLLLANTSCRVVSYSKEKDEASYTAKNIRLSSAFTEYELVGNGIIGRVHIGIPGEFSVYNSMAALIAMAELGFDFHEARKALSTVKGVKGRIEVVPTDTPYTVIIDYAHTPDALENILSTLRKIAEGRVISVFGCGGDRDKTKRPIMGEIGARLADYLVVTSDNPRTENAQQILEDIKAGIPKGTKTPVFYEVDRTKGISHALHEAKKGDIVLLAGKGHETYQILGTQKIHYDEREIINEILKN